MATSNGKTARAQSILWSGMIGSNNQLHPLLSHLERTKYANWSHLCLPTQRQISPAPSTTSDKICKRRRYKNNDAKGMPTHYEFWEDKTAFTTYQHHDYASASLQKDPIKAIVPANESQIQRTGCSNSIELAHTLYLIESLLSLKPQCGPPNSEM